MRELKMVRKNLNEVDVYMYEVFPSHKVQLGGVVTWTWPKYGELDTFDLNSLISLMVANGFKAAP